jgi:hypothetical protein
MARVKTRWFCRTGGQRIILCGGGAKSGPITPYRPLPLLLSQEQAQQVLHGLRERDVFATSLCSVTVQDMETLRPQKV